MGQGGVNGNIKNWTQPTPEELAKEPKPVLNDGGDGRRNNGDPARFGKYNGRPDQMARKFRLAVREFMSREEIKELVEQRFVQELLGQRQVKIAPTILKIAAGNFQQQNVKNPEQGWIAPAIHVHMNVLSDEQLKDYYEKGIVPEHLKKLLPAARE